MVDHQKYPLCQNVLYNISNLGKYPLSRGESLTVHDRQSWTNTSQDKTTQSHTK